MIRFMDLTGCRPPTKTKKKENEDEFSVIDALAGGTGRFLEHVGAIAEDVTRPDNMTPEQWREHASPWMQALQNEGRAMAERNYHPYEDGSVNYHLQNILMSTPESLAIMAGSLAAGAPVGGLLGAGANFVRSALPQAGRIGGMLFDLAKAYQSAGTAGKLARTITPASPQAFASAEIGAGLEARVEQYEAEQRFIENAKRNGTYVQGQTEQQAREIGNNVFWDNMGIISMFNAPQYNMLLGKAPKSLLGKAGQIIGAGAAEGSEEIAQELAAAHELGEPAEWRNIRDSGIAGLGMGIGMHGAGRAARYGYNRATGQPTDEEIDAYIERQKSLRKDASKAEADFYHDTFRGNVQDAINRQDEYREDTARQSYNDALKESRLQRRLPALRSWADKHSGGQMSDTVFDSIVRNAQEIGVPVERALATAIAESNGNQDVTSGAGAIGVMQLMPETAQELGVDPNDTEQNIRGGIQYLKQQYDRFGDWNLAHAAYNAGAGNVEKAGNRVPAFYETQNYVAKINGFMGNSPAGREGVEQSDIDGGSIYNAEGITYLGDNGKGEGRYWVRQGDNVSFDGAQPDLLNAVDMLGKMFYERTGKKLVVTAGTNGQHADGEHSHGAGWKVDIADAGANGVALDEDGALFTSDYRAQPFLKEFIAYGRSLGLGMNLEAEGTPNVHIDVALDGTQWDGNGDNAGGFNRNNVSQSRVEEIFNERYDPNKIPVPQWGQALVDTDTPLRTGDESNQRSNEQEESAGNQNPQDLFSGIFSNTNTSQNQQNAPEDVIAATDNFLEKLRTDGNKPETLLKLQTARRSGDIAKMENILRQNGITISSQQLTAPKPQPETQSKPQVAPPPQETSTPPTTATPSPQSQPQAENVVQNNQPPENVLPSPQPQQETTPSKPKQTKEQREEQKHINRVRKSVRAGVENRAARSKQGKSIIWLAEKNGIEIPDGERHGLEIGAPNMVRSWRDKLLEAGILKSQPASVQDLNQNTPPPTEPPAPPVSEEQRQWDNIKQGYQERGGMVQKAREIMGIDPPHSAPTAQSNIPENVANVGLAETLKKARKINGLDEPRADQSVAKTNNLYAAEDRGESQSSWAENIPSNVRFTTAADERARYAEAEKERQDKAERERQESERARREQHQKENERYADIRAKYYDNQNTPLETNEADIRIAREPISESHAARAEQGRAILRVFYSAPFRNVQLPAGLEQSLSRGDIKAIETAQGLLEQAEHANYAESQHRARQQRKSVKQHQQESAQILNEEEYAEEQQFGSERIDSLFDEVERREELFNDFMDATDEQERQQNAKNAELERHAQKARDKALAPISESKSRRKEQGKAIEHFLKAPSLKAASDKINATPGLMRGVREGYKQALHDALQIINDEINAQNEALETTRREREAAEALRNEPSEQEKQDAERRADRRRRDVRDEQADETALSAQENDIDRRYQNSQRATENAQQGLMQSTAESVQESREQDRARREWESEELDDRFNRYDAWEDLFGNEEETRSGTKENVTRQEHPEGDSDVFDLLPESDELNDVEEDEVQPQPEKPPQIEPPIETLKPKRKRSKKAAALHKKLKTDTHPLIGEYLDNLFKRAASKENTEDRKAALRELKIYETREAPLDEALDRVEKQLQEEKEEREEEKSTVSTNSRAEDYARKSLEETGLAGKGAFDSHGFTVEVMPADKGYSRVVVNSGDSGFIDYDIRAYDKIAEFFNAEKTHREAQYICREKDTLALKRAFELYLKNSTDARIDSAVERVKSEYNFSEEQLEQLGRIREFTRGMKAYGRIAAEQFNQDHITRTGTFDFREEGGFDRLNKIFNGKLIEITDKIFDYTYNRNDKSKIQSEQQEPAPARETPIEPPPEQSKTSARQTETQTQQPKPESKDNLPIKEILRKANMAKSAYKGRFVVSAGRTERGNEQGEFAVMISDNPRGLRGEAYWRRVHSNKTILEKLSDKIKTAVELCHGEPSLPPFETTDFYFGKKEDAEKFAQVLNIYFGNEENELKGKDSESQRPQTESKQNSSEKEKIRDKLYQKLKVDTHPNMKERLDRLFKRAAAKEDTADRKEAIDELKYYESLNNPSGRKLNELDIDAFRANWSEDNDDIYAPVFYVAHQIELNYRDREINYKEAARQLEELKQMEPKFKAEYDEYVKKHGEPKKDDPSHPWVKQLERLENHFFGEDESSAKENEQPNQSEGKTTETPEAEEKPAQGTAPTREEITPESKPAGKETDEQLAIEEQAIEDLKSEVKAEIEEMLEADKYPSIKQYLDNAFEDRIHYPTLETAQKELDKMLERFRKIKDYSVAKFAAVRIYENWAEENARPDRRLDEKSREILQKMHDGEITPEAALKKLDELIGVGAKEKHDAQRTKIRNEKDTIAQETKAQCSEILDLGNHPALKEIVFKNIDQEANRSPVNSNKKFKEYCERYIASAKKVRDANEIDEYEERAKNAKHSKQGNVDTAIRNLVDDKDLTLQQKLLKSFGGKLGVKTLFFEGGKKFHGKFEKGAIYVNVNSGMPIDKVFWHESFHWLRNNNPELYKALVKAAGISTEQRQAYLTETERTDIRTPDEINEEVLADMMDDVAKRTGLFQSIAGKNRGLIERAIQWLKDTMNKFIDHFRNPQGKLTTKQSQALADEFGKIANQLKDSNGNQIFRYNNRTHNIELADNRERTESELNEPTAKNTRSEVKYSIDASDNSNESFKQRLKNFFGVNRRNERIHNKMKRQLEDLSGMKIAADHLPEGVQVKIDKIAKSIRTGREYDWANILPEVGNAVAEQLKITQSAEMSNYIAKFILDGAPNDTSAEAKEFAKAMRDNPEMRDKVMAIRETFGTWNNMSTEEQMIASTSYEKEIPPLKERTQSFWKYLRTQLFDTQMPIHYHVAKFEKATGLKLSESINPEIAFRNLRGMQQRAMRMVFGNENTPDALKVHYPNVDFSNFKPIAVILESIDAKPGSQKYMQFDSFIKACHFLDIHRHNENVLMQQNKVRDEIKKLQDELAKADTKKKKAELERSIRKKEELLDDLKKKIMDTPDAFTRDKCAEIISKHKDEFSEAQKDMVQYSRTLLAIMADSGIISRSRYHQLLNAYPNYVPLHREFDENPDLNTADSMKHMLGSSKDMKDSLAAISNNTFDYIQRAEKNKAKLLLANLANFDGVGGIFELVGENTPNDGTIIHFYENGKRKALQCSDKDIVEAVNTMNTPTMNLFLRVLHVPALILRATATGVSPSFILGNFLRDPQDAYIFSKGYGGAKANDLVKDLGKAFNPLVTGKYMLEAARMGKLFEEYAVSGGAQADFFSFDRDYKAEAIDRLTKKNFQRYATPKGFIDLLGKLGEWTELATRLRQYEKVKTTRAEEHGGINIYDDLVAAAFESRDLIDFARHGQAGRMWNTLTAFANPVLQGFDKQWRTYDFGKLKKFGGTEQTEKEFKLSVARLFLGNVLPAMVLALLFKDEDWYKDDVQDWEKENYWILGKYFRVPKGADVGGRFFSNLTERLISNDPVKADKVLQPLKGILPDLMPTAFLPIFECMANYDLFRRRPIVPQREINKFKDTPELQYDSQNSKLAVLLGRSLGVSPRYIDHMIYGYASGAGREAMHILDTVTPGRHEAWTRRDIPFFNRILRTPYRNPKIVSDYYEELGRQESFAQRVAWEKQHGNPNAKPPAEYDPALHSRLKNIQRAMQNLNSHERAMMDDPKLTSEQVYEKREEFQRKRVELCRRAFQQAR